MDTCCSPFCNLEADLAVYVGRKGESGIEYRLCAAHGPLMFRAVSQRMRLPLFAGAILHMGPLKARSKSPSPHIRRTPKGGINP